MTDHTPDIRRDTKYYRRHLVAFYAGLTPIFVALLYTGFYVQSFVWFLVVTLAGFLVTVTITMCILPYPICATCGRTVRQRPLGIHAETGRASYYCSACDIRWIVEELHKPCNGTEATCDSTGKRSIRTNGYVTISDNANPSAISGQWSAWTLLGLGIAFCLIGLTMANNSTTVESMESFKKSFHKMLNEPDIPYPFARAALVFYTISGVIMICLSFRKPNGLRALASFFGALLISIVLSKLLFGRLDLFILVQLLACVVLFCCGYGASNRARGTQKVVIGTDG